MTHYGSSDFICPFREHVKWVFISYNHHKRVESKIGKISSNNPIFTPLSPCLTLYVQEFTRKLIKVKLFSVFIGWQQVSAIETMTIILTIMKL